MMRFCPCTTARSVPSARFTTWAIFASVPMACSCVTSSTSSCSASRCVTSASQPSAFAAARIAATLLSRPTFSGATISGKMTISRSGTSGNFPRPLGAIVPSSSDAATASSISSSISSSSAPSISSSRRFSIIVVPLLAPLPQRARSSCFPLHIDAQGSVHRAAPLTGRGA